MKEFLKTNLMRILIIIPICSYAIGFFIHNSYLSKYQITNFELLKGRYILVGIFYIIILSILGFFLLLHTSLSNVAENIKPRNLFLWLFRFEIILLVFYSIFPNKESFFLINIDTSILGINISSNLNILIYTQITSISLILLGVSILMKGMWGEKKEKKIHFIITLILYFPMNYLIFFGILNNPLFKIIVSFSGLVFFTLFFIYLGVWVGEEKKKYPQASVYFGDYDTKISRRKIEVLVYLLLSTIVLVIVFTSQYSRSIYEKLPQYLGGGKPVKVEIYYTDSTNDSGFLIDETSDNVFFKFDKSNSISIINKAMIKEVKINQFLK